jgi:hypothetical protein
MQTLVGLAQEYGEEGGVLWEADEETIFDHCSLSKHGFDSC